MFRPIKNFINYIQNASGNAIFGNAAAVAGAEEVIITEANKSTETIKRTARIIEHKIQMAHIDVMKEMDGDADEVSTEKTAMAAKASTGSDYEDDIELQIKSSIMLKQPLKNISVNSNVAVLGDLKKDSIVTSTRDHNQNDAMPDELEDFQHDPMQQALVIDGASVTSEEYLVGEDTADDLITEEEDAEESFLDVTNEVEKFPGSEIIVLNDADLNSSIASEPPSEDPLAIDDFTQPSLTRETPNLLDSSTNDEASTSGDIMWINIEEIKAHTVTPNLEKDSCDNTPNTMSESEMPQAVADGITATETHKSTTDSNRVSCHANSSEDHAEELRSDGSDSGLGSETSTLQTTLNSLADTSHVGSTNVTPTQTPTHLKTPITTVNSANENAVVPVTSAVVTVPPQPVPELRPLRSNLKRRLEVDDALDTSDAITTVSQQKKPKRSINFENVKVYYFPRQQGFGCVPSAGGCTLGMGARHIAFKTLTLAEHAAELRRAHRLQLQEINPRGSSSDDSEESEEDYLSEGSGSDLDAESNGFLQPVSPKQRRALLKAAGVRKIDASEKVECRDIRNSREVCGCTCVDFCDPETCACSQAGIKCQVDRAMFPCGCSRDACGNTVGRVEFNPTRVRTHFIHTIMRLEMENRQQQNPPLCGTANVGNLVYGSISASCTVTTTGSQSTLPGPAPHALPSSNYYNLQSQSNYSSGYASPAYTSEQGANYYQPQNTHYGTMPTTDIHTTPPYQLDSLDAGMYPSTATATPSYGDLMPAYGSASTATATSSVYHNMSYSTLHNGSVQQAQVSSYASYHHTATASYLPPQHDTALPTTYSSCAVPSNPPYGTATTTAASSQYHSHSGGNLALETTAPSCLSIDGSDSGASSGSAGNSGSTNFISLNTPIASSSRISQINDLLQHNRNTNATLVAVSQCASTGVSIDVSSLNSGNTSVASHGLSCSGNKTTAVTDCINTLPIEEATHKSWLACDVAPTKRSQAEPPPPGTSDDVGPVATAEVSTGDRMDTPNATVVTNAANAVTH